MKTNGVMIAIMWLSHAGSLTNTNAGFMTSAVPIRYGCAFSHFCVCELKLCTKDSVQKLCTTTKGMRDCKILFVTLRTKEDFSWAELINGGNLLIKTSCMFVASLEMFHRPWRWGNRLLIRSIGPGVDYLWEVVPSQFPEAYRNLFKFMKRRSKNIKKGWEPLSSRAAAANSQMRSGVPPGLCILLQHQYRVEE